MSECRPLLSGSPAASMEPIMSNLQPKTNADVLKILDSLQTTHVHVGITDHTGQVHGKYISKAKFVSALDHGMAMTRNFAAVDFKDVIFPVEGLIVHGDGFGDGLARIVPESCRQIPWESPERNLFFLIEHSDKGQTLMHECCVRAWCRKPSRWGSGRTFPVNWNSACSTKLLGA